MSKLIKNSDDRLLTTLGSFIPREFSNEDRPTVCVVDRRLLGVDEDRFSILTTVASVQDATGSKRSRRVLTNFIADKLVLLDKVELLGGCDSEQAIDLLFLVNPASFDVAFIAHKLKSLRRAFTSIRLVVILDGPQSSISTAATEQWLREQNIALAAADVAKPFQTMHRARESGLPSCSIGSVSASTSLGQALSLASGVDSKLTDEIFIAQVDLSEDRRQAGTTPFLSIVTRTHGKRFHTLRDVFCCLSAQECTDFEHLIVAHNLDTVARRQLSEIIKAQIPHYQDRIRVVEVRGGNRTRPINAGFDAARGHYVAIFDDDDIVFANWIEAFREQALLTPGRMLRASSVRQEFEEVTINGLRSSRAVSGMHDQYGRRYHHIQQLSGNSTPPVSVAFPRYVFADLGQKFDEDLTTTEDWEYMVRCSSLVGVGNIEEITSIYRWWNNAYSSRTDHTQVEWDNNHARIKKQLSDHPYILSCDTVLETRDRYEELSGRELWAFSLSQEVGRLREEIARLEQVAVETERDLLRAAAPNKDGVKKSQLSLWGRLGIGGSTQVGLMHARAVLVENSGLFDPDWYLRTYPDVKQENFPALDHFVRYGSTELRSPGPNFDAKYYYISNRDVREFRYEPLFHYINHGRSEGRKAVP